MNEINISALEVLNDFNDEEKKILENFAKYTKERIIRNIIRLGIGDTERLRRSINAIVYTQANGREAVARFFYMNYAYFTEWAVGKYRGVDDKGVTIDMIGKLPEIEASNFGAFPTKFAKHRAKPYLKSEIRVHLKWAMRRLAAECANTATAYWVHGLAEAFEGRVEEEGEKEVVWEG